MRVNNNILVQENRALLQETKDVQQAVSQTAFQDVLDSKLTAKQALQFSKHAFTRLSARNIQLSNEQLERVRGGIAEASQKGIRDSLVLVDDVALVVNVRSKTVITAMNPEQKKSQENIFTNIDGAVIV